VIDALNDNGIFLLQKNYDCEDGVIVQTVFLHESGEQIDAGMLHVPAGKRDPQGYGSALTYARRYSLMAACGIAPEDDDGNATKKQKADEGVMADHLAAIEASATKEELITAYSAALAACDGDQKWQAKIIEAKKQRIERAKK
jgi:hypothetical protein